MDRTAQEKLARLSHDDSATITMFVRDLLDGKMKTNGTLREMLIETVVMSPALQKAADDWEERQYLASKHGVGTKGDIERSV